MHVTHLSLTNFRNYGRLELDLPPHAVLLYGDNAQGKTNLLEALYYLATTKSPHADTDQQLINWEADHPDEPIVVTRLVAHVQTQRGESRHIELRLIKEQKGAGAPPSFRREALVDRRKVRLMDLLGQLRTVLFLPSDVQMVQDAPAQRRRYLDIALCQTDPVYCRTLSAYNKTLEQRNATLRALAEGRQNKEVLAIFSERLVAQGSHLFWRRAQFMAGLAQHAQRIHYEALTAGRETIRLGYLPRLQANPLARGDDDSADEYFEDAEWLESQNEVSAVAERFTAALAAQRERDLASGMTTVGPHRDDWRFWVNGRSLASYGSRGQQRSAMLALKMAEIELITHHTGELPLLLLDDVTAELDEQRRELLLHFVQQGAQALLTATEPTMFTPAFLAQATCMQVQAGRVKLKPSLNL